MNPVSRRLRASITHPKRLVLALAIGAVDGADIGSMGLAMARLRADIGLTAEEAGAAASASMLGLLLGALIGGRLADRYGRGPILAGSAILLGIFSLATALAGNLEQLVVVRFLAGLGIGGVFPVVIAIAHDSVVPEHRSKAVGVMMASGPLGAAAMAFVAMAPDWRVIFYVGGGVPLLLGLIAWSRRGEMGEAGRAAGSSATMKEILFGGRRGVSTLLIWIVGVSTVLANYLMINWMPSLLLMQGLTENQSHLGAACYSVGGIFGNLLAGAAVDRDRPRLAYCLAFVGAALVMGAFSLFSGAYVLMLLAGLSAFFIIGAQLVTFALAAGLYPEDGRATGLGILVSIGRLGSIAGPLIAGSLLHAGFGARSVLLLLIPLFALALLVGLLLVLRMRLVAGSEGGPLLVARD